MKRSRIFLLMIWLLPIGAGLSAQADRWQQRVEYKMEIDFNVKKHQFQGIQNLVYYNNSPDTLTRVFYHLYFNAFQPGSMMDVRSRTITDPDSRVSGRIEKLKKDEAGYHQIKSLNQDGKPLNYEVAGTVLEVELNEPILPGEQSTFIMEFESQVPIQIRRSGRDNAEGIAYSMAQWYPKMVEYDYQGWHANPYIGREFYGVWGDFDVKITIDKDYIIGGTGYLQNPDEIGYGYQAEGKEVNPRGRSLTWHFVAPNVHDFMWAADPDYTHTTFKRENGMVMHFLYQKTETNAEAWELLPSIMDEVFSYLNKRFGEYPYEQYSFIQGGDGGMEYPMATLITGERSLPSLVGVSIHELLHSWYQMVLGTNESLYAWMDEGFTSYASAEVTNHLYAIGKLEGRPVDNPHRNTTNGFANFTKRGIEEPLSTHADHFTTNTAYGVGAYTKGALFLSQLGYIIGEQKLNETLLRYFNTWKFKHPNANDFVRIAEKVSGLELDWYKEYWVNTTHTIDYGIQSVEGNKIILEKIGVMPMPLDVLVTYTDGSKELFNIPLRMMRGAKQPDDPKIKFTVLEDWPWTNPTYEMEVKNGSAIQKIEIDPLGYMVDTDRENNLYSK